MSTIIEAKNATDAFVKIRGALIRNGDTVAPRGQRTVELRNVIVEVSDPSDCLMIGCGRKLNTKLAALEALQLIGGVSVPKLMAKAAPNTEAFLSTVYGYPDGVKNFRGAYGPRAAGQIQRAIERLTADPYTRQAVATIWHPSIELVDNVDMPCTVYISWLIRDGYLEQTTHMRSNDLYWGWSYDVVQFTQLQITMADALGIPAGTYTHVVDSLHYYERDADAIDAVRSPEPGGTVTRLQGITGPGIGTWLDARNIARRILENPRHFLDELSGHAYYSSEVWFATKIMEIDA